MGNQSAADELRALKREGGEETGFVTDAYLAILGHYLKEPVPSSSTTNAPGPLPKTKPEGAHEEE